MKWQEFNNLHPNLASVPNIHRITDHNIGLAAAAPAAPTPTPLTKPIAVLCNHNVGICEAKIWDTCMFIAHL